MYIVLFVIVLVIALSWWFLINHVQLKRETFKNKEGGITIQKANFWNRSDDHWNIIQLLFNPVDIVIRSLSFFQNHDVVHALIFPMT